MPVAAVNSTLDVANWFAKRSEQDGRYLETEKMFHLLALAQIHFALNKDFEYLVPSLFVCNESGFYEPTLGKLMGFGLPLMPAPRFADKINSFLELIWSKYSAMELRGLEEFIKTSASYKQNYQPGRANIVSLYDMASQFRKNLTTSALQKSAVANPKKVLISQNGPVVVSQWQPRKLTPHKSKEKTLHA